MCLFQCYCVLLFVDVVCGKSDTLDLISGIRFWIFRYQKWNFGYLDQKLNFRYLKLALNH
jgi:hypothetical protein